MEQEEYKKEEINWSYIEFVDNQDILDLIEKVCGWWYISVYLCSLFSGPVSLLIKVLWDFLSDKAIPSYYLVFSQGDLFLLLLGFLPHSQYFIDCSFLVNFFCFVLCSSETRRYNCSARWSLVSLNPKLLILNPFFYSTI